MTKCYAAPTLTVSGAVVRETLGNGQSSPEEVASSYKEMGSGSVGFYL